MMGKSEVFEIIRMSMWERKGGNIEKQTQLMLITTGATRLERMDGDPIAFT